ncbi:MAG: hypothetical protein U0835_10865 [Isosphaeraceae bacterium]
MRNGVCPKCGKQEIHAGSSPHSVRDLIALGFFGWGPGKPARVTNYVCGSCGYLESYVHPEDLPRVTSAWRPVETSAEV